MAFYSQLPEPIKEHIFSLLMPRQSNNYAFWGKFARFKHISKLHQPLINKLINDFLNQPTHAIRLITNFRTSHHALLLVNYCQTTTQYQKILQKRLNSEPLSQNEVIYFALVSSPKIETKISQQELEEIIEDIEKKEEEEEEEEKLQLPYLNNDEKKSCLFYLKQMIKSSQSNHFGYLSSDNPLTIHFVKKYLSLSGKNLSGVTGSNLDLRNLNMINTNLSKTDLSESNLEGSDLSGANLSHANLRKTNLLNTNLENAILKEASFFARVWIDPTYSHEEKIEKIMKELRANTETLRYLLEHHKQSHLLGQAIAEDIISLVREQFKPSEADEALIYIQYAIKHLFKPKGNNLITERVLWVVGFFKETLPNPGLKLLEQHETKLIAEVKKLPFWRNPV